MSSFHPPQASVSPWAVIFDMDGTMVDNRAWHEAAWVEMGRRYRLPITGAFYQQKLHSRSNAEIIREWFGSRADSGLIQRMTAEKEAVYRELYAPHVEEITGLRALLNDLCDEGIPCAVASNSPQANIDFVLDALELRSCFQVTVCADDVVRSKPDPEIIWAAAERLGVAPHRCAVLEDSVSGFQAAEAAGAVVVMVTAGMKEEDNELFNDCASQVVRDFSELSFQGLEKMMKGKNDE